jgi:hypothetical protein
MEDQEIRSTYPISICWSPYVQVQWQKTSKWSCGITYTTGLAKSHYTYSWLIDLILFSFPFGLHGTSKIQGWYKRCSRRGTGPDSMLETGKRGIFTESNEASIRRFEFKDLEVEVWQYYDLYHVGCTLNSDTTRAIPSGLSKGLQLEKRWTRWTCRGCSM